MNILLEFKATGVVFGAETMPEDEVVIKALKERLLGFGLTTVRITEFSQRRIAKHEGED